MNAPKARRIIILLLTLLLSIGVVACGPEEEEPNTEALVEQTRRIAQDYQSHQNLDLARSQLNEIEVANSTQWLIFVTESAISQGANPAVMNGLVDLTLDLGFTSDPIQQYAAANGLLPEVVAAAIEPAPAPQAQNVAPAQPAQETENVAAAEAAPAVVTLDVPTPTEAPPTAVPQPIANALDAINVRGGPGTNYNVVGALQSGEEMVVTAKNQTGDWWEVLLNSGQSGWVFGQLVSASNVDAVAVAANIPQPPPPTATPVPAPTAPPPVAEAPAPAPEAPAAPPVDSSNPYFTMTGRRLWEKQENDGCRGKHLLRIYVKDAAGNPLNGVTLKGVYVGEEIVTGAQGKGDGIMEYDLHGSGEAFTVIRDADGRDAGSDQAGGFTTRSLDIDKQTLIATNYCSNDADCDVFYSSYGCHGHHSWEAVFVRNY